LGALDREDITSAIFEIIIPAGAEELLGEIRITYFDAKGNELIASQQISYEILDGNGSQIYVLIIAAIVSGAAYFAYKKFNKKK
ncbi:MAG: hypothetical protein PHG04_03400, partial [Candidatus Nanoarchaeia archaeon]|nr:hypothetical protein [Candidatus Nanoarchaeia archaeon]